MSEGNYKLRSFGSRLDTMAVLISCFAMLFAVLVLTLSGSTQFKNIALVSIAVVGASLALSIFIARLLQAIAGNPLRELAEFTELLSKNKNYSLRLSESPIKVPAEEFLLLKRFINASLEEIEKRGVALSQASQALARATKASSAFVLNAGHEIRTPISNIIGFTEMLGETVSSPEERRFIQLIESAAYSLLHTVNEILDVSKLEEEDVNFNPSAVNLFEYLPLLLGPLELKAKRKKLIFSMLLDSEVPQRIEADPMRLGQVLVNLVENAVEFTEAPGKITIEVKLLHLTDKLAEIYFGVEDCSTAIISSSDKVSLKQQAKIDSHPAQTAVNKTLGLAISNRIIKMMGGNISFKSNPEQGSIFSFSLIVPIIPASQAMTQTKPSGITQCVDASISGSCCLVPALLPKMDDDNQLSKTPQVIPPHVLVVEDNALSREIAAHRLNKAGFMVTTASNGKEAVELVQENNYSMILMDVQMPVMDGFEAAAEIRRLASDGKPRVPIIAFTANAIEGYKETCLRAGMDDYITKPISESDLLRFLQQFTLPFTDALKANNKPADSSEEILTPGQKKPEPKDSHA